MSRIVAIDFGETRIGLATSDATGTLASPRVTLRRKSDGDALEALARFCAEEEIDLAVFGTPRSPEGVESPFAARIRSFAKKFRARTGLRCVFHEETLTSDEAARRIGPGRERDAVDRAAAAVLLEDYLRSRVATSSEDGR